MVSRLGFHSCFIRYACFVCELLCFCFLFFVLVFFFKLWFYFIAAPLKQQLCNSLQWDCNITNSNFIGFKFANPTKKTFTLMFAECDQCHFGVPLQINWDYYDRTCFLEAHQSLVSSQLSICWHASDEYLQVLTSVFVRLMIVVWKWAK